MPAPLEPLHRVECTYEDCFRSFDTERIMKQHKRHSDEHDYCHKCDEDFEDVEAYTWHKIMRPLEHDKACRICGEELKSESGLKRHIETNHAVNQKLVCIGCNNAFYRACLFLEHLEFGHCDVIPPAQFQGHIVHKHLITELLKDGAAHERFRQKTSKFEAAIDTEEEGGISLDDHLCNEDDEINEVKYKALEPDAPPVVPAHAIPYPPLPSQSSDLASTLGEMTLEQPQSETSTQTKVWSSRNGKVASSTLFPNAKATPAPSEFSIAAYDNNMDKEHGLNIMRDHFWDPMSSDWNAEHFFDSVVSKYFCPFPCEQNFLISTDLSSHIINDHRITRMKCPSCLKYFKSATALMAHCESRGARCQINKADDFNIFLNRISGGFLGVEEKIRADHLHNPTFMIHNENTGHMERYMPTAASYLQYMVTAPPDYKPPVQVNRICGPGRMPQSRW